MAGTARGRRARVCSVEENFPLSSHAGFVRFIADGGRVSDIVAYLRRVERFFAHRGCTNNDARATLRDAATLLRIELNSPKCTATARVVRSRLTVVKSIQKDADELCNIIDDSIFQLVDRIAYCTDLLSGRIFRNQSIVVNLRGYSDLIRRRRLLEASLDELRRHQNCSNWLEAAQQFVASNADSIAWVLNALARSERHLPGLFVRWEPAVIVGTVKPGYYAEFIDALRAAEAAWNKLTLDNPFPRLKDAIRRFDEARDTLYDLSGLPEDLGNWLARRVGANGGALRAKAANRIEGDFHALDRWSLGTWRFAKSGW